MKDTHESIEFHPYPKSGQIYKATTSKTLAWTAAIVEIKKRFNTAGITTCEIRHAGCWKSNGLSFAHVDKRRHLKEGELMKVVLACIPCHQWVEKMPRPQMRALLENIINTRARGR